MTSSVEVTRECPSCRQMVTSGDNSCPQCGKEITNSPKKPGKAKGTPAKAAKVDCPYCGELVSKRSKKCHACRTSLPAGFYKVSAKSVDKKTIEPETNLVEQIVQAAGDETNRSPNPSSPVVLVGLEPQCQESETPIEGGLNAAGTTVPVNSPPLRESSETVEDQNRTAGLSVPLESTPVKEPDLKTEDQGRTAETVILVESTSVGVSSEIVAGLMGAAEPIIQSNAQVPVEVMPGTIGGEMTPCESHASVDSPPAQMPSEIVRDDWKAVATVDQIDSAPAMETPKIGSVPEMGDSISTQVCEAIVLRSSLESPSWIAALIKTAPHMEQVQPAAEPSKAQPQEGTNAPVAGTGAKPMRSVRKRKLKSAKIMTVLVSSDG